MIPIEIMALVLCHAGDKNTARIGSIPSQSGAQHIELHGGWGVGVGWGYHTQVPTSHASFISLAVTAVNLHVKEVLQLLLS